LTSALAPTSRRTTGGPADGSTVAMAGRDTLAMRPMTRVAAAMVAPELPSDRKPSACPSFTIRQPTTIELSRFDRTAAAACSPIPMTSVAVTASTRSCPEAYGTTISAGPTRSTRSELSDASAAVTPSSTAAGAWSPPAASSAIVIMDAPAIVPLLAVGLRAVAGPDRATPLEDPATTGRRHSTSRSEERHPARVLLDPAQDAPMPPATHRRPPHERRASRGL
jgi:hypothetical protein